MRNGQTKVLVSGDRWWKDEALVRRVVACLFGRGYDTLIHGDCRGVDRMAGEAGRAVGMFVVSVPAPWKTMGYGAGPRRNRAMLRLHPDLVVGIHASIATSTGTKDMLEIAEAAGVPTILIASYADLKKIG